MNPDYWLGVLSVPALILGAGAGWLALKAIGWLGERLLVGGVKRLTSETSEGQRAATASVVYGTRRAWMFAPGDMGFIFVVGMDHDEVRKAADRLRPRVSLRDIQQRAEVTTPPGVSS